VRAAVAESGEGRLQFELTATGVTPPPDSDQGFVQAGYASLTTVVGVAEAWPADEADGAGEGGAVLSGVVPGAPLEPVHVVPDASAPRSLHRPLHAGATPTP
jgi:hypothetical protein